MNPPALAMSLDNLLVLLVFILLSAASTWLTKKRSRKEADPGADKADLPPSPAIQGRSTRPLDLGEALRQLLGGEPSPQAPPPPPIPSAWRAEPPSPVGADEESFAPERTGPRETRESYEGASERVNPTTAPVRLHAAWQHVTAAFDETNEGPEKPAGPFEKLDAPPRRPATVASNRLWRRSRQGARAVALVRDARTVQQAFVASLVFAPPKALEI
jgi:hypothetical protein